MNRRAVAELTFQKMHGMLIVKAISAWFKSHHPCSCFNSGKVGGMCEQWGSDCAWEGLYSVMVLAPAYATLELYNAWKKQHPWNSTWFSAGAFTSWVVTPALASESG